MLFVKRWELILVYFNNIILLCELKTTSSIKIIILLTSAVSTTKTFQ